MKLFCKYFYLAVILLTGSAFLHAQQDLSVFDQKKIQTFSLYDPVSRSPKHITINASAPLQLFVFLSPECPLCQNYTKVLNDIHDRFKNSLKMYGIIPGVSYTNASIINYLETYDINFPILKDENQEFAKYFEASITPEVLLLDGSARLIYRGAIDNWAISLGKQRVRTTAHYLQDAIEDSLLGLPVDIKQTQAVGCTINKY